MKQNKRDSPEVHQRAVRMVFEHQGEHASQWAATGSIAGKFGCTPETLRNWIRQTERDRGLRDGWPEHRRARTRQGA
ncbi:transposase of ISAli4, IS3 family subgroup IS51 [Salinisphaera hydrothermalis C27AD]